MAGRYQSLRQIQKQAEIAVKEKNTALYMLMIKEAISSLKEPRGSSWHAIAEYLEAKHNPSLPPDFKQILYVELKNLTESGDLTKVRSSFKLPDEWEKKPKTVRAVGAAKEETIRTRVPETVPELVAKPKVVTVVRESTKAFKDKILKAKSEFAKQSKGLKAMVSKAEVEFAKQSKAYKAKISKADVEFCKQAKAFKAKISKAELEFAKHSKAPRIGAKITSKKRSNETPPSPRKAVGTPKMATAQKKSLKKTTAQKKATLPKKSVISVKSPESTKSPKASSKSPTVKPSARSAKAPRKKAKTELVGIL